MAVDSLWGNTSLLLPLRNDLLDAKGHVITANNGAALSSAVGNYFGAGNALYCDGTNDFLSADSADFTLGNGDLTIEFGFYPVAPGGHGSPYGRLLAIGPSSTGNGLYISSNASDNPMTLLIEYYTSGYSPILTYIATPISNDAWHWFQLDRIFSGGNYTWNCYVDGTLYATKVTPINLTRTELAIGANTSGTTAFKGYFSDVRITKGAARPSHAVPSTWLPQPEISGIVYDSVGGKVAKVVTAQKRSTLGNTVATVSNGTTGAYTLYPIDYTEHVVTRFDTATYPLVDGGSGENAIIYDRVTPG